MLSLEYKPYTLDFNFAAGTSRGVMHQRKVWFIKIGTNYDATYGLGEVAPLKGLSFDDIASIEPALEEAKKRLSKFIIPKDEEGALALAKEVCPKGFPSVLFALETALLDLANGGARMFFDNHFYRSQQTMKINGLIWMGNGEEMKSRIDEKVEAGFDCIKMKIGAIEFKEELALLRYLREKSSKLIIRVDANGAFDVRESLKKLKDLADLDLHSIEQPILPSQMEAMQLLCSKGAVKVALDEELVGHFKYEAKEKLLDFLNPPYIVLKPSLLGGFEQTRQWIRLAEEREIGWWITSALESNIGLNAICQLTSTYSNSLHQGLGTGQLYHNNITSPLHVEAGEIQYLADKKWVDPFAS